MKILAFDPGTTVGWAAGDTAGSPSFGSKKLPAPADLGYHLKVFDGFLQQSIENVRPDAIAFEAVYIDARRAKAVYSLVAMAGHIRWAACVHGIRCYWYSNGELKEFFVGKAGFGKRKDSVYPMIPAAAKRGWRTWSDHEADALAAFALAAYRLDHENGQRFALQQELKL